MRVVIQGDVDLVVDLLLPVGVARRPGGRPLVVRGRQELLELAKTVRLIELLDLLVPVLREGEAANRDRNHRRTHENRAPNEGHGREKSANHR